MLTAPIQAQLDIFQPYHALVEQKYKDYLTLLQFYA